MTAIVEGGLALVRRGARGLAPRGISARLKLLRLSMERRVYRRKIGHEEFREALLSLGEWKDRPVWVQPSWNDLYNLEMRPTEIIEMMLDMVGQRGTLMMPAFPLRNDPAVELAIDSAPVSTGLVAELFRRLPGVQRSVHLYSSAAAYGPDAEYLTASHHTSEYAWSAQSPYGRLHELRGLMVGLGVVPLGLTPLHNVECVLHHEVPAFEKVFDGEVTYRWRRRNGETGVHTTLVRTGRIQPGRLRRRLPSGLHRQLRLSNLSMQSAPAYEAIEALKALALRNETIYVGL